ncbi:hypothetical protein [Paenibacillus aestuarii]|uniref:HTH merR-type domain-containing protein n=1 Tax=Paenibacillus aestuarii TaxID=516965 RepID=A0ABW0K4G4_9BACL|nr:hypothetical protein [Paenibacillus aestuarii]
MLEIVSNPNQLDELSRMLGLEPSALLRLCRYIESRGHTFKKSLDGRFDFSDRDIAVILSNIY